MKKKREIGNLELDLENTFIDINSRIWKNPRTLSLENLGGVLSIKVNENIKGKNVSSIQFVDQNKQPNANPNKYKTIEKTYISVDDNYLYVWIPNLNKWKRILLSNWE